MAEISSFYSSDANAITCPTRILGCREKTAAKYKMWNTWKQFNFSVIFLYFTLFHFTH